MSAPDTAVTNLPANPGLASPPPAPVPTSHPPAIYFFFWGEFAERASYYGMRAILFLYMTKALMMPTSTAGPAYSLFKMGCYFLPLLGGIIADRWLGRYWTIVGFSVPYILGHFILGIPNEVAMYIALALLAGGSGVIKPNISTLMGETYDAKRPGQDGLRSQAFLWFYFAINVGALISTVALPEIRQHYILTHLDAGLLAQAESMLAEGKDITPIVPNDLLKEAFGVAFAFPAWLMVASLLIFALGKPFYHDKRPEFHPMTWDERRIQIQSLAQLFGIFGLIVLFWIGYEHNDTLWVGFISDYIDLKIPFFDKTVAPDQLQFLNPLFVIIMVPVFSILFVRLDPHVQIFTPMRKIFAGFLLTTAAIAIMSVAGFLVQGHTAQQLQGEKMVEISTVKLSLLWPTMAYIVLTIGEVLLYGTMLDLAYTAAPKNLKGFVTACFLLTSTLGNFINMLWTPYFGGSLSDAVDQRGPLMPGAFFGITALITLAASVAFLFMGRQFERTQAKAAAAGVT